MRDAELLEALAPSAAVAATLWGMAYEHGPIDRAAIAAVIANRTRAQRDDWGRDLKAVCLSPDHFPCWARREDGRYGAALDAARHFHRGEHAGRVSKECVELARMVVLGMLEDVTDGATHFACRQVFESDAPPAWAVGKLPCFDTGNYVFFRL